MIEPTRDRWGRPLITPVDGGEPVAYARASSLGKTLEDGSALAKWQQRMVVTGLVKRRGDLIDLAATSLDDKAALDRIASDALDAAAVDAAANRGTALHAATEAADLGRTLGDLSPTLQKDLDAYLAGTAHLQTVAAERFVVCDELQVAGTFDRLYRTPDGRLVIGDLKGGQSTPQYPISVLVQLAIYSRGTLYHPTKGRLSHLPDAGVDQHVGYLVHVPTGSGTCTIHDLDLDAGWELARLAVAVREARKTARGFVRPHDVPATAAGPQ
jgi:hypothetical protein